MPRPATRQLPSIAERKGSMLVRLQEKGYLGTVHLASLFGKQRSEVVEWCETGQLEAYNINNRWRVYPDEVYRYLREGLRTPHIENVA